MDEYQECVREVDGASLVDHKGVPVTVERFLASRPLRVEISTRAGPGGKKLSYMGGETVIKTLNDAFGYDGWSSEVRSTTREEAQKDDKGRHHVAYVATVRVTHRRSGAYREDCGVGDAIDRSLASASGNALKGAVTDALKRAARQFGEKLGNSLYHDGFNANNAPGTLKESLDALDIERAKTRFGFPKDRDRVKVQVQNNNGNNKGGVQSNAAVAANANRAAATKRPQQQSAQQHATNSYGAARTAHRTPAPPATRTQYVGNAVMEHSNGRRPHATPHQGVGGGSAAATAQGGKGAYVTPANRSAHTGGAAGKKGMGTPFDPTGHAAAPAAKLAENSNPQRTAAAGGGAGGGGLNLPARPNTSRGAGGDGGLSPTSTYISQLGGGGGAGDTPSMFAPGGGMSRALAVQTQQSQQSGGGGASLARTLKRKSEGGADGGGPARNPYSQAAQQGQ